MSDRIVVRSDQLRRAAIALADMSDEMQQNFANLSVGLVDSDFGGTGAARAAARAYFDVSAILRESIEDLRKFGRSYAERVLRSAQLYEEVSSVATQVAK